MTLADVRTEDTEVVDRGRRARPLPSMLPPAAVAILLASPVIVAMVTLGAEAWQPVGDLAHMVFRTSEVGTADTPLVGAYTVKGWAHPGPLLFWMAAPLYRLTGGDPRGVEWTTAIVNVACIVAFARVAWRRGGWALLLVSGTFLALLLRGLAPDRLVSVWNPNVPLLPFLLTIVLFWDAALGRRRASLFAVVPAAIAMQGHLAFVVLVVVLAVWLAAWCLLWPRLLPGAADDPPTADEAALPRPPWGQWVGELRWGVVLMVVLWAGPIVDLVVDLHNPVTIAKSLASPPAAVGPINAVGLVSRYVRPDGPWMGGAEPTALNLSVQGSGPLPYLVALGLIGGCVHIARQRRLVDVLALSTLTLVLLLAALPATSQIVLPAFAYLTQWLKIVGCMVWLTVAWTAWRVFEPAISSSRTRLRTAGAVAAAALVGGVAMSWPAASNVEQPNERESKVVAGVGALLEGRIPRDQRIRVELRGDYLAITAPGVVYWLIDHGYDVVTSDGRIGLKWGHEHRWSRGDDYDMLLTVAVGDTLDACARYPGAREVARYDKLSPEDRSWLTKARFRRMADADALSPEEQRRAKRLEADGIRVGVFESSDVCAENPDWRVANKTDRSVLPVLLGAAGFGTAAAGGLLVWRLRRRRSA